ncbi:HD domain-containing protein [Lutispora thermophila]|uniref:Putative HD superfamily hydrolase of NAD metabolism n=1 Tax=Lutispora thermophila DSM 19022 TaxID=1122184 RepID=A0A1M6CKF8_9FIRM|nr:HD domain-containing protein [Lutispora thermophila]SHI61351.1 putative HD superfamily hydrolase of NAD metabolism [Lutispora thermophila DSM 19022]
MKPKNAYNFGMDEHKAFVAGCLHDLCNLFSDDKKIAICNELGISILPEEHIDPSLLHSKISKVMAAELFSVEDKEALSAIECHSTLKANADIMDMILFVADKIS